MKVSVSEAKGQLTDLVKRAEAGDEVILTRHGHAVARLVPVVALPEAASRRALMERLRRVGAAKALPVPIAARSQDFLYDEDGLPR
jgi:prevent-host-death family protein